MKKSTKTRIKILTIGITLFSILFPSCSQSKEEKLDAIINKLELLENYKTNYKYRLEPIKYQATGNDSLRIEALEKQLTDEKLRITISSALEEVFNKNEINDIYQFMHTSAFEKFFKSGETYKAINSRLLKIDNEIEELTKNVSSVVERPTFKFKPIPVERENGFFTIKGTDYSLEDKTFELIDEPVMDLNDILEVKKVYSSYDNHPEIEIVFTKDGARKFHQLTKENIGKPIAIVIGKHIVSMPTVNTAILGGKANITGDYTEEEIDLMVKKLKE